jgi:hypothetical protein
MTTPSLHPLIVRAEAAQAVVDRFNGKPLVFGTHDCICAGSLNVRRMGYPNPMKGSRPYRGEIGARRALREALTRAGADPKGDLGDLLDALSFERIAPAMCLAGDLVGYPADGGWPIAIGVAVGNGRAFAYNADGFGRVGEIAPAVAAWRVEPCR